MRQIRRTTAAIATIGTLLAFAGANAHAQTVITGTHIGANGQPQSGNANGGVLSGFNGGDTGDIISNAAVIVENATVQGGDNASITGTDTAPIATMVEGGQGPSGLDVIGGASLTVNSGSMQGGKGGDAYGYASQEVQGGTGGQALYSTALDNAIYGGTFTGGKGGNANGTCPLVEAAPGGYGAWFDGGTTTIFGGVFTGGAGGDVSGSATTMYGGPGGAALFATGGTVSIYGGTFTSGQNSLTGQAAWKSQSSIFAAGNSTIIIYGTDFTYDGIANYYGAIPQVNGSSYGSFTGLLADNNVPATYQFGASNATIVLAPEPSESVGLGAGVAMVLGLGLVKARRRVV